MDKLFYRVAVECVFALTSRFNNMSFECYERVSKGL